MAALRMFTDESGRFVMKTLTALRVDQRSLRSLFHRGYIEFDSRAGGFKLAEDGRRAIRTWEKTDVTKEAPGTTFAREIRDAVKDVDTVFKRPQPQEAGRRTRRVNVHRIDTRRSAIPA